MFLEKLLKIALKNAVRVVCYVFEGEKLRAASNPSFPHVNIRSGVQKNLTSDERK